MKQLTLLSLLLGALLLVPTGAFARDKDKHHKHHYHHDWSERGYRGNDRDYRDNQRQIEADRLANGYNRDGSPRYYYRGYYHKR
ncbi:MAG: hypothetical protein WDN28_04980 [Chthoniobacter sp.]